MHGMELSSPEEIAKVFENCIQQYGYMDIGAATGYWGVTSDAIYQEAIDILKRKGYMIHITDIKTGLNGESVRVQIITPPIAINGKSLYEIAKEILLEHEKGYSITELAERYSAGEDAVEYWIKRAIFHRCVDTLSDIAGIGGINL